MLTTTLTAIGQAFRPEMRLVKVQPIHHSIPQLPLVQLFFGNLKHVGRTIKPEHGGLGEPLGQKKTDVPRAATEIHQARPWSIPQRLAKNLHQAVHQVLDLGPEIGLGVGQHLQGGNRQLG